MTPELIISLISLVMSFASGIFTAFVTLKVGKLNNLEAIHKYQKKITPAQLQFKTKEWFLELMDSDEFGYYDTNSQTIILAWWKKINQEDNTTKELQARTQQAQEVFINNVRNRTNTMTGRRNVPRVPILPNRNDMTNINIPVDVVIPLNDVPLNLRTTEELRHQYNTDIVEKVDELKQTETELSFDDLLEASSTIKK